MPAEDYLQIKRHRTAFLIPATQVAGGLRHMTASSGLHKVERGFPQFYPQAETIDPEDETSILQALFEMTEATSQGVTSRGKRVEWAFQLVAPDLAWICYTPGDPAEPPAANLHGAIHAMTYQQRLSTRGGAIATYNITPP